MEEPKVCNEVYEDEIDLIELSERLYKKKWVILTATVLGFMISLVISISTPKTYKATALYKVKEHFAINQLSSSTPTLQPQNPLITPQDIIRAFEIYKDENGKGLTANIKIINSSQSLIEIDAEGNSPEAAKTLLLNVEKTVNGNLLKSFINKEVYNELKTVELEINTITETLDSLKKYNVIYDPISIVKLKIEKQELEKFAKDPTIIIPLNSNLIAITLVKPKPLLYISIGTITGFILGVFLALLKMEIEERKASKRVLV